MVEKRISPDALQSFYGSHELLMAINDLSIHTKLRQVGVSDEARVESAQEARGTLTTFLERFEKVVEEAERGRPLMGVSPRFGQLARNFVAARSGERDWRSDLVVSPISETARLFNSADEKDQETMIDRLSDLRVLIEEHITVDTQQIFNRI